MTDKNPTFSKDGKRRIFCQGCKRFLTMSYIGQKEPIIAKCKNCGSLFNILPPEQKSYEGKNYIFYGSGGGTGTVDLTDADVKITLEPED